MDELTLLSKHLVDYYDLQHKLLNKSFSINAKDLIVSERIDLIAKLLYVRAKCENLKTNYFTDLYKATIESFSDGTFLEPGNPNKNSFSKYIDEFNQIISSVKSHGFDPNKSIVPIGENGAIIDGAHRVATCAYFGQEIKIIKINGVNVTYDVDYFKKKLLDQAFISFSLFEYAKLKSNIHVVCVWPRCSAIQKATIEKRLCNELKIIYKNSVLLSFKGLRNFLLQTYRKAKWIGTVKDNFQGLNTKVVACYDEKSKLDFYVIEESDLQKLTSLKNKIRKEIKLGNDSIHSTDTQEEAIEMLGSLMNENSIFFLNNAEPDKYSGTFSKVIDLHNDLTQRHLNYDDIILDAGIVLSLYGIRSCNDLDYLTKLDTSIPNADNHNSQLKFYCKTIDDLLYNPSNYFYFFGLKFTTIQNIFQLKKNRDEVKDQEDILLIESFFKRQLNLKENFNAITIKVRRFLHIYMSKIKTKLRDNLFIYWLYSNTIKRLKSREK